MKRLSMVFAMGVPGLRGMTRVAGAALILGMFAPISAGADEPGAVTTGGQSAETGGSVGIAIGGGSSGSSGGSSGASFSGLPITCNYSVIQGLGFLTGGYRPSDGQIVWRTCYRSGSRVSGPDRITYSAGVAAPAEAAQSAARAAFASLEVPVPTLAANPGNGVTIPNVDTWLWINDTGVRSESVSLAGVTATVTARFDGATFDVGDEGSVSCADGGERYDTSISYRDQDSSCVWRFEGGSRTATVSVTARWELSWTSSVGIGGDLADVVRNDALDVEVQALRSVIRNR